MRILISGLFLLFSIRGVAQTLDWAKKVGGVFFAETQTISMASDNAGNIYLTGMFGGTVDFDPGNGTFNLTSAGSSYDAFVVKLTSAGALSFAVRMGGSGSTTTGTFITLDAIGNIYVIGSSSNTADFDPGAGVSNLVSNGLSDVFVCKLSSSGSFLWARNIVTPVIDAPGGIAFDLSGNPIIVGSFGGSNIDFDPGPGTALLTSAGFNDAFIWKLDASGNFLWVKQIGSVNSDQASNIKIDDAGNIYVAGYYCGAVDLNPGSGTATSTAYGTLDMFILKLDASGNYLWSKFAGGTNSEAPLSMEVSSLHNIYITGYFSSTVDFDPGAGTANLTSAGIDDAFIWKLNDAGTLQWAVQIGGSGVDHGYALVVDDAENVFVTGYFQNTVDLNPGSGTSNVTSSGVYDMFTVALNSASGYQWSFKAGGSGYDEGYAIVLDANCNLEISGPFQQTVDFDPGAATVNLTAGSIYADSYIQKFLNTGSTCTVLLPVELISFTGHAEENRNVLEWETSSELNNNYFTLWRSADASDFQEIGRMDGAGSSPVAHRYYMNDNMPLEAVNYYRLQQTDADGSSTFSDVIAVERNNVPEALSIFPNPAGEYFEVSVLSESKDKIHLIMLNGLGEKSGEYFFEVNEGINSFRIPTAGLVPGIYWLMNPEKYTGVSFIINH